MITFARAIAVGVAALVAAPAAARGTGLIKVDHHVHVHSPAILAFLPAYCSSPARASKCDPDFARPLSADDLLKAMDEAGIARARIMSTGYLAESPIIGTLVPNHAAILRSANSFTVKLAQLHPTRFQAYVAVNPVSPTALEELRHWRGNQFVTGLKLHLANARFDYADARQVKMLADVFRTVAGQHLRIMIHMRNAATGYGAEDVRIFLRDVLPAARGQPVQIAHVAGWGGIDTATLSALGAFADACEADRTICRRLTFDLAALRVETISAADRTLLVTLMRRIGISHFVPASDWPFALDLRAYYAAFAALPLEPKEWRRISRNVGP
ncbi:amidohydrolase family protein [Sphingomonas sp.]|uniref:amidohydrolase family protein n=1 Tax=Sphingomonas sp. TaxID=28214 RepID=UPI003B3B6096